MTLPYGVRLVCLCLAVFALAQLAVAAMVAAATRWALARAERMPARRAARLLLGLRLGPAGAGLFAVLALCAPSYLWLEPDGQAERVGGLCLAAAGCGLALLVVGAARAAAAAWRSERFLRTSPHPAMLTAGVLRPRVVVSADVREALAAEEWEAALRHEQAHAASWDNLKRLLVLLAASPVPRALERGRRRMAEWAADDVAVAGSAERGVALASALVRVARLGRAAAPELTTSLIAEGEELAERVERLLRGPATVPERRLSWMALASGVVMAALIPMSLPAIHQMLERLAR